MKRKHFFIVAMVTIISISVVLAVEPFGATLTEIGNETSTPDSPESVAAIAGNVTELNIQGYSVTQSWQGYYGNVTGTIQLADSLDNILYNWTLASPQGEIYASTNNSIDWAYTQCFNFTADGTYASDTGNAGTTSQFGANLSYLESLYGMESDDVDGINETFNLNGAGTHDQFYTNNLEFSEGECQSTRLFSNAGLGENDKFEEVLLYEPTTSSVIYASILDEDVLGFDGNTHDFEMMVPEDGHGVDTSVTTYYFYVELE